MSFLCRDFRFHEVKEFLRESIDGISPPDPFHTVEWLRVLEGSGMGYLRVFVLYDDEEIVSIFPIFFKKVGGLKIIERAPSTPYLGPFFKRVETTKRSRITHLRQESIKLYSDIIKRQFYCGSLFLPLDFLDIREFLWSGWSSDVRYTYINKIDNLTGLWDSLKPKVRNKIKKARELGLTVEMSNNINKLSEIIEETYRYQDRKDPMSVNFYKSLVENCKGNDMLRIYYLKDSSGDYISVRVILVYERSAYDIIAGSRRGGGMLDYNTNMFFIWRIFEELTDVADRFDFTGANMRDIAHFKSNFEGELVPFYQVSLNRKFSSPITRLSNIFNR